MSNAYKDSDVKKLLANYLYIRSLMTGVAAKAQTEGDGPSDQVQRDVRSKLRALGVKTANTSPWPFMESKRATTPRDGKQRGRVIEEMLVATIDLEVAMQQADEDDRRLFYLYFVAGYTLEELVAIYGTSSKGSMSGRINRAVRRLCAILNGRA